MEKLPLAQVVYEPPNEREETSSASGYGEDHW